MKRPMCVIGVSFSVAMWAAFQLRLDSPGDMAAAAVLLVTAVLLTLAPIKASRTAAVALLSAGLAFVSHSLYAERHILPFERYSEETVRVEGVITEMNRTWGRSIRYTLKADFPEEDLPRATVLAYYFGETDFLPGDVIEGELRLFSAQSESTRRYHRTQGIALTGNLIVAETRLSGTHRFDFDRAVILLRQELLQNIGRVLRPDAAAFVQGMVMGETDGLSPELYTAMQRSGTSHLTSVSGLHLSIFSSFVLLLLSKTRLSRRLQSLLALACCFGFFLLAGFSASLLRALVMMSIVIAAQLASRRADTLNSVGIALLLISLLRPGWTQGMGMWLSAASCAGIAILRRPIAEAICARYGQGRFQRSIRAAAEALGVSCGAYLFTLPLLFLGNGWISLLSPFANLLISPFIPILMIGGMLSMLLPYSFFLSGAISAIVGFCAAMTAGVSRVVSALPFCTIAFDRSWMLVLLLLLLVTAAFLRYRRAPARLMGTVLAVFVFGFAVGLLADAAFAQDRIELITIGDTNQTLLLRGKSAVLLTPPDRYNISRLLRYLSFRGVRGIDAALLPSYGEQIDTGLLRLYESYEIGCIIGPDDAYILGLLAEALPGVPVYPSDSATIGLLGDVRAAFSADGTILLEIAGQAALSSPAEYATMEGAAPEGIAIYPDAILLPDGIRPAWEPVGSSVFGETRIVLRPQELLP